MKKNIDAGILKRLLPLFLLSFAFVVYCCFYIFNIDDLLDSDISSEMILGDLLSKEHGILSKNWAYSTEIRVLNNQIVFAFFLFLFHNYHIARVLSGIVLVLILVACYYFFCRCAEIRSTFAITAIFFVVPFSFEYMQYVLCGLYYIPHISICFLGLGLLFRSRTLYEKGYRGRYWLIIAAMTVLAFIAGLGGPRQIVILYAPMVITSLYVSIRKNKIAYLGGFFSFAGSAAGYLVNALILNEIYPCTRWGRKEFIRFSSEGINTLIGGIMSVFSYSEGKLTLSSISRNGFCFIALFALLLYFYAVIKKKIECTEQERITSLVFGFSFLIYFILYTCTNMLFEDRYMLVILFYFIPILAFFIKNSVLGKKNYKIIFFILIIYSALLVNVADVYREFIKTDKTSDLKEAVSELQAQDYHVGYATFWDGNANVIVELSNGSIDIYNWRNTYELTNPDELGGFLQDRRHFTEHPQGKLFISLTKDEFDASFFNGKVSDEDIIFENDTYLIYGYDSREDMYRKLGVEMPE